MSAIQFRFGLSLDGHPVNIRDAAKCESYTCVNCGKPLIAKQGAVREWHFAHKTNTFNCSFETYLHKLSKYFIREMFNEKHQLIATHGRVTHVCDRKHVCPFKRDKNCFIIKDENINLLQYTTCIEEASINGFVADLLFTSETLEPLLIEIYVTHHCTEEKINSGFKIIEIHVESEADVEKLLEGRLAQSEKVIFHNFSDKAPIPSSYCSGHYIFHGFARNNQFEQSREKCNKAFWPKQEFIWELYADENTKGEFLKWDLIKRFRKCISCYWYPVKNKENRLCRLKHNFVFETARGCQLHLIDVEIPSICHQGGKSYIYHHPLKQDPQRLNIDNTQLD